MRRVPLQDNLASFAIITDASPRGLGAIICDVDLKTGALEISIGPEDAEWIGIPYDDPSGQGPLEGWAVLAAIRFWGSKLVGESIIIKSDSVVALAMVARLSAKSPVLNWLGSELALKCESLHLQRLVTKRIPGAWNVESDWLSRPHQRGEMPERLKNIKIKTMRHDKLRTSAIAPPGIAPGLWGSETEALSRAYEAL